jgi:hypothetical protein
VTGIARSLPFPTALWYGAVPRMAQAHGAVTWTAAARRRPYPGAACAARTGVAVGILIARDVLVLFFGTAYARGRPCCRCLYGVPGDDSGCRSQRLVERYRRKSIPVLGGRGQLLGSSP